MDHLLFVLVVLGWPGFMMGAMLLTGDLELPQRVEEWLEERWWEREERRELAAESVPADPEHTTGAIVLDDPRPVDPDVLLTGGRWWRRGRDLPALLVTEQSDFVFGPHWCVYEVDELEPRLIAAFPVEAVPTIQDLLGRDVQPRQAWQPRWGAVHYPWKPVPAFVVRSLGGTASWVGRQEVGAWM